MAAVEAPMPGFSFENCTRNKHIEKLGLKAPTAYKTGTTIAGIIYKDGVVLGADTRATEDTIVADKNCSKIHYLADNICCGAGTAADTEMTTQMISSQLELHKLNTARTPRGHISAALVLGGVDVTGPHLYRSGSLAAMATFEDRFKPDMEKAEAMKLVRDAIAAGIFNDLGSGSNVDICVITKGKILATSVVQSDTAMDTA
ncbi:PSB7-like protein [Mya arenaria]|uniref:Proteasome subunit beta n=1 Tax=Mya arenaria TaxID=6604 RepID=A0ABY7G9K6_MYAAR|nr:PSB7-like protein [Mya arenaria]